MPSRNVRYVLVDIATGFVESRASVPRDMFDGMQPPEGKRLVVPADGVVPGERVKLDLRKVRKPINFVSSIADVQTAWRSDDEVPADLQFATTKGETIEALDRSYAERIEKVRGPLAALHAEKRRQAETGGGPLVADEADRLAVLANAAAEDERIAGIERQRRAVKAAVKAATTDDEIKAALASATGDDPKANLLTYGEPT